MPSPEDQLRHDASSLYQFVESITSFCGERSRAVTYLHASEKFFDYVRILGEKTKDYLVKFPTARSQYLDLPTYRRKLSVLRAAWKVLHQFVKPAADADTLNLPSPLIDGLIRRFREIPRYKKVDFVIFHTDEFNYLQVRLSKLKKSIDQIANLIPGAKPFQAELGLIGIPYSQCSSLFMNCLIPHEMGHYVYADQMCHAKLLPRIEAEVKRRIGSYKAVQRSYLIKTVAAWAEELFCDLFAALMVGPCYTLAYVELFDLVGVLDEKGKLATEEDLDSLVFYPTHPAHLIRIKHQVSLLDELGWWREIRKIDSHYVDVMRDCLQISDNKFSFRLPSNLQLPTAELIKAFQAIIPRVEALLQRTRKDLRVGVDDWKRQSPTIEEYLAHGVVPSTLYGIIAGEPESPGIVSLLNASYKFYLESLGTLLKGIEDGDGPDSVKSRSKWAGKVEDWTVKAIEDHRLISSQKDFPNAGTFKKRN